MAAVVPVLTAAAADPFGDIGLSEVLDAASAVLVTALVTYGLAVWPSLRLGFRVKRAIFAGGVDLAQPFAAQPGTATWVGFRSRSPQPTGDIVVDFARWYRRRRGRAAEPARVGGSDDGGADGDLRLAFPRVHVYRHEDDVFGHIGRRKRGEMPVDLLFSLRPYLTTVTVVMLVVGFASFLAGGGLAEEPGTIFLVPVMVAIAFIPAQAFWELRANARRRQLH